MRIMANNLSPARSGRVSGNVLVRNKDGKPRKTYLIIESGDGDIDNYNRFKLQHAEYFSSNEHVSNGPFSHNFGSFTRGED